MTRRRVLMASVSMWVISFSVLFFAANAFPWGSATHAYIGDKIGKESPILNLNEIYGAMAPDIFNFYPDILDPNSAHYYLYMQTHYNALALWAESQAPQTQEPGKAAAFGFASHANGQFDAEGNINDCSVDGPYNGNFCGADRTAHGLYGNYIPPPVNPDPKYVIDKANLFWLPLQTILAQAGIIVSDAEARDIAHNLIEFAIDIMVAYEGVYEPGDGNGIGKKMIASALLRNPEFPQLLVDAYAKGLSSTLHMPRSEARKVILADERDFRKTIVIYGQALTQKTENDAIDSVSEILAQLAQEVYGIEGVTSELVKPALIGAQAFCRNDYAAAIQGTVAVVNNQMQGAGISY